MYPVLRFLSFTLPVGPLAALLAFYVGTEAGSRAMRWFAVRAEPSAAWSDAFGTATLYGLLTGLVGARLGYAAQYLDLYLAEPAMLFSVRPGTLALLPGMVMGAGVVLFVLIRRRVAPAAIADASAVALLAALVVWNVGQFLTGDAYGVPGNVPWTVDLWGAERHPVQVYVAIALLVGLLSLLWWWRQYARPGQTFWRALLIYGLVELFFTTFRSNPDTWMLGIREVQVYSLAAVLVAMFVLSYHAQQAEQANGNSQLASPE